MLICPVFQRHSLLKKSLYPTGGSSGQQYELYNVNKLHIAFIFARWVYDLSGEFCHFCGFKFALEVFQKKVQKGGVQRAAKGVAGLVVAERERNTQSPNRKGVKMMEAIPRDYGQGQFDAFCKKVLKNEARAYLRNMKRQRDRETMFSDLPQHEFDKLCTVDRYPSDSFVFSSHGYDLHIDNELVADAFADLPQQEQSILILYCVLDMADGEIASLTGMSRSAVQRHRTKTLKELRVKLMALMPEGG